MNELPISLSLHSEKPAPPAPTRTRWQPLRLGLVELFHYDSEEFWFRDGHLLLRGNNGTGKSKVLSLTLPFLFDAQLKPSRIEPDGDNSKRMAWNLLLNSYDRRMGYAWIEFGRVADDGAPRYLTLGAGLSAATGRPHVDSWFFVIEDADGAPRINQDIWLTTDQRVVLTKERLREALEGRGQVFETATSYRRAVDERLFRLGGKRYDALIETLIQLRQPQLSKKPDETALSDALTEALPPLAPELLGDIAEAFGRLEEDRHQLQEYQELAKAVERFEQRYRLYAGTQSRRQARALRQAQTEFDNASRARTEAETRLRNAESDEALAQKTHDDTELALKREQARLDTLRSDPTMQDANRLEDAEKDATARQRSFETAVGAVQEATRRLRRASEEAATAEQRVELTERKLAALRQEASAYADAAGIVGLHAKNPIVALDRAALASLTPSAFDDSCSELRKLAVERRQQIELVRRRCADLATADAHRLRREQARDERRDFADAAARQRGEADANVDHQGQRLTDAWDRHFAGLQELRLSPTDRLVVQSSLAEWVASLEGDNPAQQALRAAQQKASVRLAQQDVLVQARKQTLESEQADLEEEQHRLHAGVDTAPPPPYTRALETRRSREGGPLWQLIEFRDSVTPLQRAGLESALEASGLLDAWISPDGQLQTADGSAWPHDIQALQRSRASPSLSEWLCADVPAGSSVSADVVDRIIAGVACADDDPIEAEAWISPSGRFRLGPVTGAWSKPEAVHVGYAARAAARARRLLEISDRLAALSDERRTAEMEAEQLARQQEQAASEWRMAPTDEPLRSAHLTASARARDLQVARERLDEAESQLREAEQAVTALRQRLAADAADLRLPTSAADLSSVETQLSEYDDARLRLAQAAHELRLAAPELERQRSREQEALDDLNRLEEQHAAAHIEAEEASMRLKVLREAVGTRVEELQRQLADARAAVQTSDGAWRRAIDTLRKAAETRAVAGEQATAASTIFEQGSNARAGAVSRFQQFAAAGLLSAALPQIELPDMASTWTIDPALTLARRSEQALSHVKDDEEAWARVQRQIGEDFTELQRALSALSHQALAEQSDWGLIVYIVYQNRPERPDRLGTRLAQEIAQRSELLTANERAVLENHLQAEIASEIQRLLQAAEAHRDGINKELYSRPTSTGVRYRLLWEPLSEADGAPVGLEAARKRLLNTNADLWSAEDRRVVGAMLQQRIAVERELADSGANKDGGGSLLDQLARALDYRHWHRFRVERWQDGHWRKLSGPASSGERALGLTVPLFAAVASFYSHGSYDLAPRVMLLDEAFAGIDDSARAHCMGLIREFDLDFIITSEREWACYAELPGVSICQLQRREGIDAVFVSRWTWDGRAKKREADPDRRFSPK